MRINRIFQNISLDVGHSVQLDKEATNHIVNVLKLHRSDLLILLNGEGEEFPGHISEIKKNKVIVVIDQQVAIDRESPFKIHLAQCVSKNEKMDFTIQKAVELGVHAITPIMSERGNVHLSSERWSKKMDHWNKVMIGACEQCGRNVLPTLHPLTELPQYIQTEDASMKLILHHTGRMTLQQVKPKAHECTILIGPEGGFSEKEIILAKSNQFLDVTLGPRILRTETAGLTIISILQGVF